MKKISTLVGIIIIAVVVGVAFGGVFAYQYFSAKTQPKIVQSTSGICGSANGQTFSTAPTTGLCSAGTASVVTTPESVGGWYWTCTGLDKGASTHCTAFVGSTQSYITIISPNGGEKFVQGQTVNIKYDAMNGYAVALFLVDGKGNRTFIAGRLSGGSYLWTVPSEIVGNYKIAAEISDKSGTTDLSDNYFTITK